MIENDRRSPTQPLNWSILTTVTFVGQRLVFGGLVLLAIIYLTHLGLTMARGVTVGVGLSAAFSKSLAYVSNLLQGELGLAGAGSLTGNPTPIVAVVPNLVLNSLGLLAGSLLFAVILGVSLGFLAAQSRRSNRSTLIIMLSIVGISMPSFFVAPLLQLVMIQWTKYFGTPLLPLGGFGWDARLILPALVLAARPTAQISRVTFVTLSEVMNQDFIRVADSKGLRFYAILLRHIFPNAAIPILTTIGLSLRFSLSSLPVVEFFFGWPGIGFALLKAVAGQDDNLTVALILCIGLFFIIINLLLEMTYPRLDPRLREAQSQINRRSREPLAVRFKDISADLIEILADNPLNRWLKQPRVADTPSVGPKESERRAETTPAQKADLDPRLIAKRRRHILRGTFGNLPFISGGVIVLCLLFIVFFGPALSPHSPYTTQGLKYENGQLSIPPFAPDEVYPWGTDILGRDLMSLILAGAQQTLLLTVVVVAARLLLGFILGVMAGWWHDSWLDRLLLSLAEIIAAFPTLLLTMLLIVALGIRQGLQPFIISLCFVGWGEIMQFVRSQVLVLRLKPFIESAVAIGLRTPRLLMGHILPNLIPALISLAALEMGAVLILLGELGFIGIFIGGGTLAEVGSGIGAFHYSDIPEWGALLSNIRTFARAYSWMAFYPVTAFFLAILGFNLFGEGLRRLVDDVGLSFTPWFNRYMLALIVIAIFGFNWVQQNTGPVVFYRQNAREFTGQQAWAYVEMLTDPALQGRALGTAGLDTAAELLAAQFKAVGLQPAGENGTYFYPRERTFERLTTVPTLKLHDKGPAPIYLQDYAPFPTLLRNIGQAEGQVRFMTTGPLLAAQTFTGISFRALQGLDYQNDILLVSSARDAAVLRQIPNAGILVIAADETTLQYSHTLLNRDPIQTAFGTGREQGQDLPMLSVTEEIAGRLLQGSGFDLNQLQQLADGLVEDQFIDMLTPNRVLLAVEGDIEAEATVSHILGYMPGTAGVSERNNQLDSELIIVVAPYDAPPTNPDGLLRPNANNNASGVAVMLEAIRTLQESDYQPFRSFLFVAYSAQGLEGGEVVTQPDPSHLLQARSGFGNFDVKAVVQLRGLGTGQGRNLVLSTGGSQRLANVFESAARQIGVSVRRIDEPVDLRIVFDETAFSGGQEAPQIGLSWQDWQLTAGSPEDKPELIEVEKLEQAGQTLSLALMRMGREAEY